MSTHPEITHIPPYSEEAERAVLGSIIMDAGQVFDLCVTAGVSEDTFYVPAHRLVYAAVLKMSVEARAIDIGTLSDYCKTTGCLEQIGGGAFLDALVDAVPTSSHAEYYTKIILEKQLLRKVIASCREIEAETEGCDDAENLRSKAEYIFGQLRRKETDVLTPAVAIQKQFALWETAQKTGCAGIPTGFEIIDKCFGGLMEAAFMVISGPAGACKTTLARNVVENIGMRGIPASVCSLEQTAEQIWGSVVARDAKQSVYLLNCGSPRIQWDRLVASAAKVQHWPIYVDDRPKTPSKLWSWARYEVNKHGAKLLVLDYLQALTAEERYRSDESRITAYSATCRAIAKDLRVPFIVISMLSNEGNLRGSGAIGYDAWGHIRIKPAVDWAMPDHLHYIADIEKQRFGPTFKGCDLWLVGNEQRLEERKTQDEDVDYPQFEGTGEANA